MANTVLILGEAGAGKSTSQETLNPEETFIINVTGKPLPFKGWKAKYNREKKNYHITHNHAEIVQTLNWINTSPDAAHIKNIIIDDFQYVMSFEYMARAKETGFGKFTEMAQHVFKIIDFARLMRDDLNIVFLSHSITERTETGTPFTHIKTIGKLLDEKITVEGLFTTVLLTQVDPMNSSGMTHYFLTQNDGTSTAKSPRGMFDLKIPNDLKLVLDKIHEYNNES